VNARATAKNSFPFYIGSEKLAKSLDFFQTMCYHKRCISNTTKKCAQDEKGTAERTEFAGIGLFLVFAAFPFGVDCVKAFCRVVQYGKPAVIGS
jgi:hypothetical protein